MAKKFTNWEPSQDSVNIDDDLCAKLSEKMQKHRPDYSALGDIHKFCLELSTSIDLPVDAVLSVTLAVTQWSMNRSLVECKLMGITETTYDFIANCADSGAQKTKAKEFMDQIIKCLLSEVEDEGESLKENDPEGFAVFKRIMDGEYALNADSTASFKRELTNKPLLVWSDDELCQRLKDLCKDGGINLILQIWNRHKQERFDKCNDDSQCKLSEDLVLIINSNIQLAYALYLLLQCGFNGLCQRWDWNFLTVKRISSDDIASTRSGSEEKNDGGSIDSIHKAASVVAKVLSPSIKRHWFFKDRILGAGPRYQIEYNEVDLAKSKHARYKALYLWYCDQNHSSDKEENELSLKSHQTGYKVFINDLKVLSISDIDVLRSSLESELSFTDFSEIINNLPSSSGLFIQSDSSKLLMNKNSLCTNDYNEDRRISDFDDTSPLWRDVFKGVGLSPHGVIADAFDYAQETIHDETKGKIERQQAAKFVLKTVRKSANFAVLSQCIAAKKENKEITQFKPPTTADCNAAFCYHQNLQTKYAVVDKLIEERGQRNNGGSGGQTIPGGGAGGGADDEGRGKGKGSKRVKVRGTPKPCDVIPRVVKKIQKQRDTQFKPRDVYKNNSFVDTKTAKMYLDNMASIGLLKNDYSETYSVVDTINANDQQINWFKEKELSLETDWTKVMGVNVDALDNNYNQSEDTDNNISQTNEDNANTLSQMNEDNANTLSQMNEDNANNLSQMNEENSNINGNNINNGEEDAPPNDTDYKINGISGAQTTTAQQHEVNRDLHLYKVRSIGEWNGGALQVEGVKSKCKKGRNWEGYKLDVKFKYYQQIQKGEKRWDSRKANKNRGHPYVQQGMKLAFKCGDKQILNKTVNKVYLVLNPHQNIKDFHEVKCYAGYNGTAILYEWD